MENLTAKEIETLWANLAKEACNELESLWGDALKSEEWIDGKINDMEKS